MPPQAIAPEFVVWTDPPRVPLARATAAAMGERVRAIGVGGPRSGEVAQLARELDCPCEDDLRKLLVERPAAFVLVTTMTSVGRDDLATAAGQGAAVLMVEPPAGEFEDLLPWRAIAGGGRLISVPAFTQAPGWRAAGEPRDLLGPPRLISFTAFGAQADASLFARLADAWRTVRWFADLPESIDAALTGPLLKAPQELRGLAGHMTAHARLPQGCSAQVTLSDLSPRHGRQLTVVGDLGCLIVTDLGYQLYDKAGRIVDQSPPAGEASPVELIAEQWRGLLDGRSSGIDPATPTLDDQAQILACCQASLLSARTGEPESPRNMLAIRGAR